MLERMEIVEGIFGRNNSYLKRVFDLLERGVSLEVSSPLANHPLWLLTHIVEARFFLLRQLGAERQPAWGDLQVADGDLNNTGAYPTSGELRVAWRETVEVLRKALAAVTAGALFRPAKYQLPIPDKTLWGTLEFLSYHETYHIGQLGLWYKQLSDGKSMM